MIQSLLAYVSTGFILAQATPEEVLEHVIKSNTSQLCAKGDIVLTVKSERDSVKIQTAFQYLSPNKVFIRQISSGQSKQYSLLVSDGRAFVYSQRALTTVPTKSDLVAEPMIDATGKLHTVKDMYTVAQVFFIDRSVPLDIVLGREDNSLHLSKLMTNWKFGPDSTVGDSKYKTITAMMRVNYNSPPTIPCQFVVSENKIIQFATKESFMDDNKKSHDITLTWDVNYSLNDEKVIDPTLFVLPKPRS